MVFFARDLRPGLQVNPTTTPYILMRPFHVRSLLPHIFLFTNQTVRDMSCYVGVTNDEGQFRFSNLASHFICIQIFQVDFLSFYSAVCRGGSSSAVRDGEITTCEGVSSQTDAALKMFIAVIIIVIVNVINHHNFLANCLLDVHRSHHHYHVESDQ